MQFFYLKLYIKYKHVDYIINNIQLIQNLICILKAYSTCNPIVKILKYVVMLIILSKVVTIGYN